MNARALLAIAITLLFGASAQASPVDALSLEELQDQSALVVHGSVTSAEVRREGDTVFTDAEILVTTCLAGLCREAVVISTERTEGAASFEAGDEVIVFLRPEGSDLVVVGMAQGVFHIRRDEQEAIAVSDRTGLDMVDRSGRPSLVDSVAYPLNDLLIGLRLGIPVSPLARAD